MTFPANAAENRPLSHIEHGITQRAQLSFIGLEVMAFAGAVAFLLFILRDALFLGRTTMTHDTVLWVYPIFTYLADGILHGHLPLWNPFSRGGEPLLPSYLQTRLLDPIDYLTIYAGSLFTHDLTTLFNWDRVVRLLAGALGTHLLLRRWARHPATRMALAVISVLSSISLNIFHQCGFNDQYYCAPFVALFVFRILERRGGWADWMGVVFFLGSSLQSYFFVGTVVFVLVIVLGYLLFLRSQLLDVLRLPGTWVRFAASIFLLTLMIGPSYALLEGHDDFQMSARSYPEQWKEKSEPSDAGHSDSNFDAIHEALVMMPYRFIRLTGTPVRPADLLGLLGPQINDTKRENGANWLTRVENGVVTSDARLAIGSFAFALSLLGMALGRAVRKRIWLLVMGFFGLLMLGPYTPVHALLYQVLPPLWIIRHTQQFANFFLLALIFFFVLGADYLMTLHHRWKDWMPAPSSSARAGSPGLVPLSPVLSRPLYVTAVLLVVAIGLNLVQASRPSLAMSFFSNPLLNCLYVLAIVQFGLAGVDWLCANPPWLDRMVAAFGANIPSFRNGIIAGCFLVALGLAAFTYLLGDLSGLFAGMTSDPLVCFVSLLAIVLSARALIRHCAAIQWSVHVDLPLSSDLRWQVSTSSLYVRCVKVASENRIELLLVVIGVCLLTAFIADWLAYMIGLELDFLRRQLTMAYGKHLSQCTYILAAFVALLGLLRLAGDDNAEAHERSPLNALAVVVAGCVFALLAMAMMPTPNAGWGVEGIARGPFGLPRSVSFPSVIALLSAATLALAASILRGRFIPVLFAAMIAAAAFVLVRPFALLAHLALFVFAPSIALVMLRRHLPQYFRFFAIAWLLLATTIELGKLSVEYRPDVEVPRHTIKNDWVTAIGGPAFPTTRIPAIPAPPYSIDSDQPVRFPELLARTAMAITTPASYPLEAFEPDTANLLEQKRANTFFTLKAYEHLLKAGLPADVVEAIFAIGAPIFQFKPTGRVTSDFAKTIGRLPEHQRREELRRAAFLDEKSLPAGWSPPAATAEATAQVRMQALDYDRASAIVETNEPGFLYFADAFADGWTATVNGVAAPILKANGHFKAIQLGAGKSVVEFAYKPMTVLWGLRLFFAILALTALLAVLDIAVQRLRTKTVSR